MIIKMKLTINRDGKYNNFYYWFCYFLCILFTLFSIIIKSNNAQQRDLDNDPELKNK